MVVMGYYHFTFLLTELSAHHWIVAGCYCFTFLLYIYTPPHVSGRVLWYHVGCPCVCPSVSYIRPTFRFWMITWVNFNGFSPNLVCEFQWIFTKPGMCIDNVEIWFWRTYGQISVDFWQLSAHDMSAFSFPDNDMSKCQWIFTKLAMCIDIVKVCYGMANRQISSIFDSYLPTIW